MAYIAINQFSKVGALFSWFLQSRNRFLHLIKMRLRTHRVGDVDNFSVEADQEAHALGQGHHRNLYIVGGDDLAVGIGDEREVQLIFIGKFFVAVHCVVADADDFDIVRLQIAHAVAEAARFFRAAAGEILRIKIQQHDFLADVIGEVERLAVLILTGERRRGVADFGHCGKYGGGGKEQRGCDGGF